MSAAFWLDSSDDSLFFAPSSNIVSSRSSAVSLDINDIPLDVYPSLLLPSRSLNALPLWDHEPAKPPPCPSTSPRRNRRTQNTFLSLVASLALPKGNRPNRKYPNVLVSSPTPGRLRNVPQLKPALKTWISAVPSSSPPDMAPWSPPRENPHYVWVPEGSCFPPSYLKRCLRERHSPPGKGIQSTFDDSSLLSASGYSKHPKSSSRSRSIRRRSSNNAYPTCIADTTPTHTTATVPSAPVSTKPRRWSINVPPSHLNTEFLNRQLEFQCLNATIGTDSAQSDAWNEAPPPPLPSIKVSTSTATIAVSVPGSPETPTPEPEPLAIRRGKKMLAPLTLRTPKPHEEYPDIPTAFLGTPSAYSPHYQFSSLNARSDTESLAIGDMINTLRSQVAGLKPSFLADARAPLLDKPPPPTNSLSAESSDIVPSISEDDWAFAHELMSRYSGLTHSKTPSKEKRSRRQAASTRKSLTPETGSLAAIQSSRTRRASVPLAVSTPKNRPKSSSAPRTDLTKPQSSPTTAIQGKASRLTTPNDGNRRHVSRPVSSPGLSSGLGRGSDSLNTLPSSSRSESSSSAKRPLGILKHVKSVRFADMPKKDNAEDNTPSVGQPRAETSKENGTPSSLQPSPLRAYFVPGEIITPIPSKRSQSTTVSEDATRISTASRRSSVQLPTIQKATSRTPVFNTPTLAIAPVASDMVKLSNSQLAAKTFSLLAKEHDKDRENIPLALRTQRRMRRYTQVDENAARRASGGEGGGGKHRLSSPLKSFFERLRA
ncbi:hypothetical protein EDB84DRAFT_1473529 [Lactarius hengduanensis]|nr:hypothetical protein EDB84DRAFT_1473529 [Lactarius hengduanensis]